MKRWLLLLLLASPAHCQVLQVAAGASTIQNAQGATATWFTPNTTSLLSVGMAHGQLVGAAQMQIENRRCRITLGDQSVSLSAEGGGIGLAARGISCRKKHVMFFTGAVGKAYSAPFFSGSQALDFGAGISYDWKFAGVQTSGVAALAAGRKTLLESASWRRSHVALIGSGGLLDSQIQFGGRGELQAGTFSAAAGRDTYIAEGQRATANSEGAALQLGRVGLHGSAFQGRSNGETFGASLRAGLLQVEANEFLAGSGHTLSVAVIQRLNQRWTIAEYITHAERSTAINFGGGYAGNVVAVSVQYQQQFFPFAAVPFQKVLSVQLSLQLPRSASAHVDLQAVPGEGLKFAGYGSKYVSTGIEVAPGQRAGKIGGVEISGFVREESGMPVNGAAVKVGGKILYTDSSGRFAARFPKAGAQPVEVMPDEFIAPGNWQVVSCSLSPSVCVVKRL